jgi:DHA2 family multidrug resistance protein-like MFS transporter
MISNEKSVQSSGAAPRRDMEETSMTTSGTRRWWALGAVSLGVLAVGLDGTVLSVALPTLAKALHASESDLQWFSSGYFLVLAAAMLPAGLLGDRYGHKKVLLIFLGLFGLGSLACAYSTSVGEFLAARVLLGLAGAGIIVMAISALTVLFNKEERPKAVGIWAAANFLALPIGPILGGWLLTNYWWGLVFLINVPVAAIGLIALATLVPESRPSERPGFDLVGVALSIAGLVSLTYGLITAGEDGWTDARALLAMIAGVAVLVGFYTWESRLNRRPSGQPLIDFSLFRSASFTWGVLLAAFAVLAMIGVLFTMPQYFQGVLGTDAMGSGLRLLPVIGGLALCSLPSGCSWGQPQAWVRAPPSWLSGWRSWAWAWASRSPPQRPLRSSSSPRSAAVSARRCCRRSTRWVDHSGRRSSVVCSALTTFRGSF